MQKSVNKDLEELKTKHTETNNTITEIKNTLEGINSRISEAVAYLWDDIKHTNIWIIEVPEDEEKKKRYEKIFEEIIVENFPNMEQEIVKFKKCRVLYRTDLRRNTLRHILIKLTKTKHKERILKAAREKQQVT